MVLLQETTTTTTFKDNGAFRSHPVTRKVRSKMVDEGDGHHRRHLMVGAFLLPSNPFAAVLMIPVAALAAKDPTARILCSSIEARTM
jgi:hypothetical protein